MPDTVTFHPGRGRSDTVHFVDNDNLDVDAVREVSRVTWVGVFVNVVLAILKMAGGLLASSTALLADAVHTISDLATDAVILVGVRYWSAPADADHPHGHRKIETLITLGIGLALALVGLGLGYEAAAKLAKTVIGKAEAPGLTLGSAAVVAFLAAVLSIVAKEFLYRWTVAKGVEIGSSAVVANAWHHRSDALSSIPPALAISGEAIGTHFGYDLWYLDPIGTLVVCVMLLQAAWEVVQPTLAALLDRSADRKLCSAIRKTVLDTPGVIGAHRIRTRVIGMDAVAVDLHVTVYRDLPVHEGHAIASKVKYRILDLEVESARAVDVMVHVEPASRNCESGRNCESNTLVDWKYRKDV